MPGQPELNSNPFISVGCNVLNIEDPAGTPSDLIIQANQPFDVWTKFELAGTFANWFTSLPISYSVEYFFEQKGGNNDGSLASVGPKNTIGGQLVYGKAETQATVPANKLTPGLYEISVVVNFNGTPPMTAFADGPVIQVF